MSSGIVKWQVLGASNSAVFSLITDDWLLLTEMTPVKIGPNPVRLEIQSVL